MSDLVEFLLARIAEDEADARAEQRRYVTAHGVAEFVDAAYGYGFQDPARVLAECEAKRRIVEMWDLQMSEPWSDEPPAPIGGQGAEVFYDVLRYLALPYADHPDYREEWRP